MLPEKITDHVAQAKGRLTSMFKDRRLIVVLLSAIIKQLQELENVTWQVIESRQLANSPVGVQLDKLGKITGEPRKGRSDAAYLEAVKLRILINRSTGKVPDLLRILSVAANGNPWEYREKYPANYEITFSGTPEALDALVAASDEADPQGVGGRVYYTPGNIVDLFSFGHYDGSTVTGGKGASYSADGTPGYVLAHVEKV